MDDRVPERSDSHASSAHEPSLQPTPTKSVDLGKHSVYIHFPEDLICEICQRTKITRAPSRRRIGEAVPRAANFGDLITADHKVLSDNCESRNNHRYGVVVQDLTTQWIQAYPCKNKTSQETQRSLQKVLKILVIWFPQVTKFSVKVVNLETIIDMQSWCRTSPPNGSSPVRAKQKLLRKHRGACKSSWSRTGSLKSITLTIPWNLARLVKIFPGIIARLHHTDRRLMGLLKEQCAE